jgi:hypothetical protein
VTSRFNPKKNVRYGHVLELPLLGIGKVHLGFPNGLNHPRVVQVQSFRNGGIIQTGVFPMLTKIKVHLVILQDKKSFLRAIITKAILDLIKLSCPWVYEKR